MPSRADVDQQVKANRAIRKLVLRDLEAWWVTLPQGDPDKVKAEVLEFLPILVSHYGEMAATVAADWYEDLRAQVVAAGFTAHLAPEADIEQVQASVRWAIGPLWPSTRLEPHYDPDTGDVAGHTTVEIPADADKALANLSQVADRYAVGQAKDTVALNVRRDPSDVRWARVPTGAETCAFCLILASRGAVYETAETAGQMTKYHGSCDCQPTPIWDDSDLPSGYDPDALYDIYLSAREKADTESTKGILSALREQQGIH